MSVKIRPHSMYVKSDDGTRRQICISAFDEDTVQHRIIAGNGISIAPDDRTISATNSFGVSVINETLVISSGAYVSGNTLCL